MARRSARQTRTAVRRTRATGKGRKSRSSWRRKTRRGSGRRGSARRRAGRAVPSRSIAYWLESAYTAGVAAASAAVNHQAAEERDESEHGRVNEAWATWCAASGKLPWSVYYSAAARFMEGWRSVVGGYDRGWVLLPTAKSVAAIVTVMNEQDTVPAIIAELQRLPLQESIYVINGSSDDSFARIRNQSAGVIVHYDAALGHDVGRAIGARLSDAEILLFLDGDLPVRAEQLVPFIAAIGDGADLALNDISPYLGVFAARDGVTMVKEFVNRAMGRSELEANSLTAVPHAMSREALRRIGTAQLAVPPKAQVLAIDHGLRIVCPASIDVIATNRVRSSNSGTNNAVARMIIGDHIEALKAAMDRRGVRLGCPDQLRQRHHIQP